MSKNATVVKNNIINITNKDDKELQDAYKPNLQLIKGTKYNQNIKKFLKTTKGKIVLCTLIDCYFHEAFLLNSFLGFRHLC